MGLAEIFASLTLPSADYLLNLLTNNRSLLHLFDALC